MPAADVLNIIKININSIGPEQARGSDKLLCKHAHCLGSEPKEETVRGVKRYTNMDSISKLRENEKIK